MTSSINQASKHFLFGINKVETKLQHSITGTNTIVKMATPIINFVNHITASNIIHIKYNKNEINVILQGELQYFTKHIEQEYIEHICVAATQILHSWITEVLATSVWGKKHNWQESELAPISKETDNFFMIMQKCANNPEEHNDILQLCYICMTLGYSGNYKDSNDKVMICNTIINRLWHILNINTNDNNYLIEHKTHKTKTHIFFMPLIIILIAITTTLVLEFKTLSASQPLLKYLTTSPNLINRIHHAHST